MRINYTIKVSDALNPQRFKLIERLMREAGVSDLWLAGFFFGRIIDQIDDFKRAREIIEAHGFRTGILFLPVGHPGNSLDPEDDGIDLRIPPNWRYRIDRHGNQVFFCADIEENMIKDNLDAISQFLDIGFTRFFMDDDLRLGNHGPEIQGCFCEECINQFNNSLSLRNNGDKDKNHITREDLSGMISHQNQLNEIEKNLISKWISFSSNKLTIFMKKIYDAIYSRKKIGINIDQEMTLGIMVMHSGDARHGINLSEIIEFCPEVHVRVGEMQFNDRAFNPPIGKAREILSIQTHLNSLIDIETYSETTIFPPKSLSPENWVFKAKLSRLFGGLFGFLDHLFLMGGYPFIPSEWWKVFAKHLEEIKQLDSTIKVAPIRYPIHIAIGSKFTALESNCIPTISGIPCCPIKIEELTDLFLSKFENINTEILLIPPNTFLDEKWKKIITKYYKILITPQDLIKNRKILQELERNKIYTLPEYLSSPLSRRKFSAAIFNRIFSSSLRKFLKIYERIPHISKGMTFALVWQKGHFQSNLSNS